MILYHISGAITFVNEIPWVVEPIYLAQVCLTWSHLLQLKHWACVYLLYLFISSFHFILFLYFFPFLTEISGALKNIFGHSSGADFIADYWLYYSVPFGLICVILKSLVSSFRETHWCHFFILLHDGVCLKYMWCDVKYQHRRIIIQCQIGLLLMCLVL